MNILYSLSDSNLWHLLVEIHVLKGALKALLKHTDCPERRKYRINNEAL